MARFARALVLGAGLTVLGPALSQALINHARNGVASQVMTGWSGDALRALDGSTDPNWNYGSISSTTDTPGAWWEVDLGQPQEILEIILHNRLDCCAGRLSNFRVSVFDGAALVFAVDLHTAGTFVPAGSSEAVLLPPALGGDVVRVQLLGPTVHGDEVLSLAEVEVLGPSPGLRNLALGRPTSQTTTAYGGVSSRAVDGWVNGAWANGTITHTDDTTPNNAWEVDLLGIFALSEIHLFNRADCCWTRLSNFRVSVLQGGQEVFGQDFFVGSGSVARHGRHAIALPSGTLGDAVRVALLGQNNDGNSFLSLSEVVVLGGAIGLNYCWSAPSSLGQMVKLHVHGSEIASQNTLELVASGIPPGELALAFYGANAAALPAAGGTLCVTPGLGGWYHRLGLPQPVGGDGLATFPVNLASPRNPAGLVLPGSAWHYQVWYRDLAQPAGASFSDAWRIQYQ